MAGIIICNQSVRDNDIVAVFELYHIGPQASGDIGDDLLLSSSSVIHKPFSFSSMTNVVSMIETLLF